MGPAASGQSVVGEDAYNDSAGQPIALVLAPPEGGERARCRCPLRAPRSAPCSPGTRTARRRGCGRSASPGDDGWFGPGSTIWSVHADAATLVGGVRALLVQAMHPTVLAGFDQHSGYREDPESRLQRTAAFVTVTTFGTSAQAEAACERVRRAHAPVRGRTPGGEPYDAGDPELLGWVHLALADSLAVAVQRYGRTRVRPGRLPGRDGRGRRAPGGRARPARPGRAGRHLGALPAAARGHRRDHRGARLPARPAAAVADPAAVPGDRRRRGRRRCRPSCAACSPASPCCPTCPPDWSAGPRPGCSPRSSVRARPPARPGPASRRTAAA